MTPSSWQKESLANYLYQYDSLLYSTLLILAPDSMRLSALHPRLGYFRAASGLNTLVLPIIALNTRHQSRGKKLYPPKTQPRQPGIAPTSASSISLKEKRNLLSLTEPYSTLYSSNVKASTSTDFWQLSTWLIERPHHLGSV
jgi:hypothetical protein